MIEEQFITDISAQELIIDKSCADEDTVNNINNFKKEWFNESETMGSYTSGSTGVPSKIYLNKRYMMNSAKMTLSFLNIKKGNTILLCMPLKFIGAKMVMVRALVGSLKVIAVTPSSHPLKDLTQAPFFAAMTPTQVANSLEDERQKALLEKIDTLIIGGGPIPPSLQEKTASFKNNIFSTYGMTETMSHIALKRLTGNCDQNYQPFDGVILTKDENNCLNISCNNLGLDCLKTKDIVELNKDQSFKIIGRLDNTINSGGIKVQIEVVEQLLNKVIDCDFNITSVEDPILGEKVVILATKKITENDLKNFKKILPKYFNPKESYLVKDLPKTKSGKPARAEIKKLANKLKDEKLSK